MWRLAHNIGTEKHSNYNTIEQIQACNEPIGFDGIYRNVYENKEILKDKSGIFFVMGNYMGKDNTFDLAYVPKLEKYCNWEEMYEMLEFLPTFKLGWHTWSHPDLTTLSKEQIIREITPPYPMEYFAYPYGRYNDLVVNCVIEAGFKSAFSVTQGSTNINDQNHQYKIYRDYIN